MRKKYFFIVILITIIFSVVIGVNFVNNSHKNQNKKNYEPSESVALVNKLKPQTNSEGAVTVSVTPRQSSSAGTWEFEITLDTHSVDLDFDLTKTVLLIANNKEYRPIAYDGDPPGGHHRKGILRFEPISPQPESITLKIFQIGGTEERTFIWSLK